VDVLCQLHPDRLIRDNPGDCGLYPDGRKTEPPAAGAPGTTDGGDIRFRDALKHRTFLFLALSEAIRMTAVGAVVTHIVPYLSTIHMPRATAGFIAGFIALLSIPGRFGFGWLADRFDKRNIMIVAFAMMSLGLFALCHVQSPWVMLLFLFPVGLGATVVLRGAFLREYFGRKAFGRLLVLVMGGAAFGSVIGPTLTGFLFDRTGSYDFAWNLLGVSSLLSVLLMLFIGPNPRATRP
jgi:MFS family permease